MSNGLYPNIHINDFKIPRQPQDFAIPDGRTFYSTPIVKSKPQSGSMRYGQAYANDKPLPDQAGDLPVKNSQVGFGNIGLMGGSVLGFE